jgi:prepilin-type N-terminal cleavage/methylation domain-containing protein
MSRKLKILVFVSIIRYKKMKAMMAGKINGLQTTNRQGGFSLLELIIVMTITLILVSISFSLLTQAVNQKTRDETQVSALSDANQSLSRISHEIANAGFGLSSNGLVAADCTEEKIRIRANLNALMKQTTSGTVTDRGEDLIFQLVDNPNEGSALVRTDVATGLSSIVATKLDNSDVNGDGDGDGITFTYLDAAGNETAPQNAVRVEITVRIRLKQVGSPGAPGFHPEITKQLFSSIVLRNSRLLAY